LVPIENPCVGPETDRVGRSSRLNFPEVVTRERRLKSTKSMELTGKNKSRVSRLNATRRLTRLLKVQSRSVFAFAVFCKSLGLAL